MGTNDRIAVAVIGIGFSSGQNHLWGLCQNASDNNIVVAAACDVFDKRRALAAKAAKLKTADVYSDYRRVLERKDIDAVLIATHDPLHARISLDAMDAGKHVYCERPLTRHLEEAFAVYDKAKYLGKTFQVGVQSCSAEGWQRCSDLVLAGKIGTLVWSEGYYCRNGGPGCEGNGLIDKDSTAESIDWNRWLGPVKRRPFSGVLFHQWRMYSDYSAGLLACQAPQRLHALMLSSGRPEFPVRVNCVSGHHLERTDQIGRPYSGQLPAHVQLTAEFPSGNLITLTCSWMNGRSPGLTIHGHKASLEIGASGDRIEMIPEKEFGEEVKPEAVLGLKPEDIREHERNWFNCIRSGSQPNADIELAIRAQTVLSLAEMSDKLKTTCLFDETTRKVTDGLGREIVPLTYEIPADK